jgi:lipoprotein-releasing system permease protein
LAVVFCIAVTFELFIAARYLRAKRRQAVIGIVTAISIIGVAAGVASLIVALAINNGFRQDLQDRLLASTAHVGLERAQADGIRQWRPLLDKIQRQPHVIAAAPSLYEQVLVSRGARASGLLLKGVIPKYESRVSELLKTVRVGSADSLKASDAFAKGTGTSNAQEDSQNSSPAAYPPIVLGQDLADGIGATVGSVVLVTSPQ